MKKLLLTLTVLTGIALCPQSAQAQQSDFQGWFAYFANIGVDPERKWIVTLEEQARQGDYWQRFNQNIVRPTVSYQVTKQFSAGVGYAWAPLFFNTDYHRTYRDENRTFLQLAYTHQLWGIDWYHRFRQEQRFIADTDGAVSNRGRYLIKGSYPLSEDKTFGIAAYNEIFVNYNSVPNGPTGGYDQDRIFIGPYWRIDNARYEVGFVEQHTQRFGLEARWAQVIMFFAQYDY